MASLRLYFFIKAMNIWNCIRDVYINSFIRITRFYEYIKAYFKNHHDTWLFIPGHTLPLPVSTLYNNVKGSWIYDNFENTLTYNTDLTNNICKFTFSWLSASIIIKDPLINNTVIEYTIDNFLEKLNIYTLPDTCPTLTIIYMAWCAHNKHWFNNNCHIGFKVITELGDEEIFNINDINLKLNIRSGKIFSVIHK